MKEKSRPRIERNKLVVECQKYGVKTDGRDNMNIKQQVSILLKRVEPKRQEEKAKRNAEVAHLKAIADTKKKAQEDAEKAKQRIEVQPEPTK